MIEVGPGPGGLTRALLANGAERVVAIERDERCLAALAEIGEHYPGRLEIIAGDALKTDFAALAAGRPVKIVANLPYNIGTELLVRWLTVADWPPFYQSLTLMFQREVARAHRRGTGQRRLWPARRAGRLADRGADRLRRAAAGLHAAAQGDVVGGQSHPARDAARRPTCACSAASPKRRSASAARCCARA